MKLVSSGDPLVAKLPVLRKNLQIFLLFLQKLDKRQKRKTNSIITELLVICGHEGGNPARSQGRPGVLLDFQFYYIFSTTESPGVLRALIIAIITQAG